MVLLNITPRFNKTSRHTEKQDYVADSQDNNKKIRIISKL